MPVSRMWRRQLRQAAGDSAEENGAPDHGAGPLLAVAGHAAVRACRGSHNWSSGQQTVPAGTGLHMLARLASAAIRFADLNCVL